LKENNRRIRIDSSVQKENALLQTYS